MASDDDKPFAERELSLHFMGRRGGKNRDAASWFTAMMLAGEHVHLLGVGWSACSAIEPCPGSLGFADWRREHPEFP